MRPVILSILRASGSPLQLHETSPENANTTSRVVPVPIRDEQFGQRPKMLEGAQNTQLSIADTPPTLPEAAVTSRHSSESPSATESATKLPEGESDRFVELLADLRAKLHTIGDESTLATIMDYAEYTANPPTSADYCADTLEEYQNPDTTSDQRFRVLRNRIVRDEAEEEIVKYLRFNIRISKLFALAELSIRYSEEKEARSAVPRKRRKKELPRLSPKDRFTNLLFPEIGNIEEEGERNVARKEAKGTFSYWITLGKPLAEMTQRFGSLILLILPENLTMTDLHHLKRPQIQDFVDYIDLIRLGLKKEVMNLTGVLLQMVDTSRPAQRQLLDILTSNLLSETRNRPPEELLQAANHPSESELA
ncbi:hypothetical protein VE03_10210 [Pseudogymnoascus sp. 23342-1-I1]|nr:hypothetical protein VE03_10210 [Pseudogymnoascus sp. 23342-1-I1]